MDDAVAGRAAKRRTELIERFGKSFANQFGWAVGLPGVTAGNFREVEELAELGHRRGFYRWSSHYVHGDQASLRMSIVRRGGVSLGVLSDLTNIHLTDPAQLTLFALHMTYLSVAFVDPGAPVDFYIASGLGPIIDQAGRAFWKAEQEVDASEQRLQAELTEEGQD